MATRTSKSAAQEAQANAEQLQKIKFHYIKSKEFRTIHVDGVHGSLTPQGKLQMAVFSERLPIPRETTQPLNNDGTLGPEIREERISKSWVVREIEGNLIMDVAQAKSIAQWMLDRVDQFERESSHPKKDNSK